MDRFPSEFENKILHKSSGGFDNYANRIGADGENRGWDLRVAFVVSFCADVSVARLAEDTAYLGAIRDAADCYESLSGGPVGIWVPRYLDYFSRVEPRLRDRCDADGSSVSTRLTCIRFLGPAAARH